MPNPPHPTHLARYVPPELSDSEEEEQEEEGDDLWGAIMGPPGAK